MNTLKLGTGLALSLALTTACDHGAAENRPSPHVTENVDQKGAFDSILRNLSTFPEGVVCTPPVKLGAGNVDARLRTLFPKMAGTTGYQFQATELSAQLMTDLKLPADSFVEACPIELRDETGDFLGSVVLAYAIDTE